MVCGRNRQQRQVPLLPLQRGDTNLQRSTTFASTFQVPRPLKYQAPMARLIDPWTARAEADQARDRVPQLLMSANAQQAKTILWHFESGIQPPLALTHEINNGTVLSNAARARYTADAIRQFQTEKARLLGIANANTIRVARDPAVIAGLPAAPVPPPAALTDQLRR